MADYPENWDELRREIYKRDRYTCAHCDSNDVEVHAHHIIRLSEGGSNDLENLTTLCKGCHEHHHTVLKVFDFISGIFSLLVLILYFIFMSKIWPISNYEIIRYGGAILILLIMFCPVLFFNRKIRNYQYNFVKKTD